MRRRNRSAPIADKRPGDRAPGTADHVVNILPGGDTTKHRIIDCRDVHRDEGRLSSSTTSAVAVQSIKTRCWPRSPSGHVRHAYLDVTDPEPLPPQHPLVDSRPNCFITPHTAGGSVDEFERLATPLRRRTSGDIPPELPAGEPGHMNAFVRECTARILRGPRRRAQQ